MRQRCVSKMKFSGDEEVRTHRVAHRQQREPSRIRWRRASSLNLATLLLRAGGGCTLHTALPLTLLDASTEHGIRSSGSIW